MAAPSRRSITNPKARARTTKDRRQILVATAAYAASAAVAYCSTGRAENLTPEDEIPGHLDQLTKPGSGDNRATFMPDGRTLLFASQRSGKSQIWTMELATGRFERLAPSNANDYGRVTPNGAGTKLCFSSDRSGENGVYVLDLATGRTTLISDGAFWSFGPSWSRRDVIAFFSKKGGNVLNIWAVHPDGSEMAQFTNEPGECRQPWWSPDGNIVAFSADRGTGEFQLWLADGNGANARSISDRGSFEQPFWHPDGRSIAVSAKIEGPHHRIYVVDTKGSILRSIRQPDGVDNIHPAWSPDGRSIVFTSGKAASGSLYVFDMS